MAAAAIPITRTRTVVDLLMGPPLPTRKYLGIYDVPWAFTLQHSYQFIHTVFDVLTMAFFRIPCDVGCYYCGGQCEEPFVTAGRFYFEHIYSGTCNLTGLQGRFEIALCDNR